MTGARDEFRIVMGEASALPARDPLRLDVEARIAQSEAWAADEWSALTRECDELRTALSACDVPPGLEGRILASMQDAPVAPSSFERARFAIWAAAAAMIVAIGAWWLTRTDVEARSKELAVLAIDEHLERAKRSMEIATRDPSTLVRRLTEQWTTQVEIPSFEAPLRLRGGRVGELEANRVAISSWDSAEGLLSLFQGRPVDFGLPGEMEARFHHGRPEKAKRCAAIWCEGDRAYVLVGLDHKHLERVLGRVKKN